jgi:energy-coupling factor transporter ATP-binding protein EcfA2
MRIKRFEIRKAFGYLTIDVPINDGLTFLTGINGAGKTTVVRGLMALLTPSFSSLATIECQEMSVDAINNGSDFKIRARRTETDIKLSVDHVGEPLTIPIFNQEEFESPGPFATQQAAFYRELHTNEAKHPVLMFINELPTPMFLDLERRGQGPQRRSRFMHYEAARAVSRSVPTSMGEGLVNAVALAEDAFRVFLARQNAMQDRVRDKLVRTAFTPLSRARHSYAPDHWARGDLIKQRDLVIATLGAIGITDTQIDKFFSELLDLLPKIVNKELDDLVSTNEGRTVFGQWLSVQPQLQQISEIIQILEKYNTDLSDAKRPIDRFLMSINSFFSDSGKRLEFQRNGRILVYAGQHRLGGLVGLSSGEKQLLVILTHLAFSQQAEMANVLIIDEPELSLHIRWQERFVAALQSAGRDVQLVLATHSPSIILDRTDACIEVRGS